MKRKILLVQVPSRRAVEGFGPYNLACLGASVENIAEVKIYNASVRTIKDVMDVVKSYSPDMVGLCAFLTANVPTTCELGSAIKAHDPNMPVVAGGHGANSVPELLLGSGAVDMLVRGEGETTFRELVEAWGPKGVQGVSFFQDGEIISNPKRPVIQDLDSLPFPSFHLLDMMEVVVHQFETSRGCPNQCAFCDASRFYGHVWRAKSPERVVEEIKYLVEYYGAFAFFPADDNISRDMERLGRICELILENDLPVSIMAQARADAIVQHPEVVDLMSRAGFHMLVVGVESGNPATLQQVRKNSSTEIVQQAVDLLKRHDIAVDAAVILGLPSETPEMMHNTVDYVVQLDPETVGFNIFAAYPGTPLYDQCKAEGLLLTDDWTRYDEYSQVVRTVGWPETRVETIRQEACKRFYNRPEWIRSYLKVSPGQEVKVMFAKGAWVTFSKTFPFTDLDTWNQALEGYKDIVNPELARLFPDYSVTVRMETDIGPLYWQVQDGRLCLLKDDQEAWDFVIQSDRETLEALFIQMELDALSAFVLRRLQTKASLKQIVDLVRWVNALQGTMDLHVGGAVFERPCCLETFNDVLDQEPDLMTGLDGNYMSVKLKSNAGDWLLRLGQGRVSELQLLQPGRRARRVQQEIVLEDNRARDIFTGDLVAFAALVRDCLPPLAE